MPIARFQDETTIKSLLVYDSVLPCHESVVDYLKHNPRIGDEPVDIEDLVNIGKDSGP